jgi:hypothetical protein
VAESAEQIREHIAALMEFEQKYSEFLTARHNRRVEGQHHWTNGEWAGRQRELRMLAPRAEVAMEASGHGSWQKTWPMALGGGVMSDDLSTLIFDFQDPGFSFESTGEEMQWDILERIPSQIAELEMQLEDGDPEPRTRFAARSPWWREHLAALVITIVGTVVGGVILTLIVGGQ